eukprot:3412933-Alexandrium_andersonii.AAC.1
MQWRVAAAQHSRLSVARAHKGEERVPEFEEGEDAHEELEAGPGWRRARSPGWRPCRGCWRSPG